MIIIYICRYVSLGEVSQGPTMENGHLVLRYESGDPCSDGGKQSSAIISLECDKEGVVCTVPKILEKKTSDINN